MSIPIQLKDKSRHQVSFTESDDPKLVASRFCTGHGMDHGDCLFLAHHVRAAQERRSSRRSFAEAAAPQASPPHFSPSDVLILSGGTARVFSSLALRHMERFATRMGYRFAAPAPVAEVQRGAWKPYWQKMFVLLQALKDRKNRLVVWMDDDGVVVRQSDMIERIAAANPTKSVIIAEDADAHAHVNSGMMIVRNDGAHHDVSVGFLRAALARGRLTREVVDVKSNDEVRAVESAPSLSPPPAPALAGSGLSLAIGSSLNIDADPWGTPSVKRVFKKYWLARCAQAYDCLHEQQAMSELIRGKEEVCEPDPFTWNNRYCEHRDIRTSVVWANHVAVIAQRDSRTGLNMNTYSRDGMRADDFWVQATGLKDPLQRLDHIEQLIALSTPPALRVQPSPAGGKRIAHASRTAAPAHVARRGNGRTPSAARTLRTRSRQNAHVQMKRGRRGGHAPLTLGNGITITTL